MQRVWRRLGIIPVIVAVASLLGTGAARARDTDKTWEVGLFGFAVGSVLHEVSHVMDRHIGGRSTDPIGLGAVALLSVAVAGLAWWSRPVAHHTSVGA